MGRGPKMGRARVLLTALGVIVGLAALSFVTTAISSDDEFAPADSVTAQDVTMQGGIVPLYSSARPGDDTRRFMSTEYGEFAERGFGHPSLIGYVGTPDSGGAMVQVHRLRNTRTGGYLYTPDDGEASAATQDGKYEYHGARFSAWPDSGGPPQDEAGSRIPVYRLYSQSRDLHHFTTSAAARDQLLRRGFGQERTKFYILATQGQPLPKPKPRLPAPKPCKAWIFSWCVWR